MVAVSERNGRYEGIGSGGGEGKHEGCVNRTRTCLCRLLALIRFQLGVGEYGHPQLLGMTSFRELFYY